MSKFVLILLLSLGFLQAKDNLFFEKIENSNYFEDQVTLTSKQILSLEAPTLNSPQNNATELSLTFNFTWNAVLDATKYWFQISTDSLFNSIYDENKNAIGQNLMMQTMEPDTKFYWRVCAKNNIETGPWSKPFTFTTRAALPLLPKLVSPEDAVGLFDNFVDFEWTKANYAKSYDLQVSKNALFDKDSIVLEIKNIDTTFYKLREHKLKANTYYYWRVRANNAKGSSAWTTARYFITGGLSSIEFDESNNILVYPNPNTLNILSIELPNGSKYFDLKIYDLNGKLIQIANNIKNIDISNLSNGQYQLFINIDNKNYIKSFIKN